MEILPIARKLDNYGFKKLAYRLVTRTYGAQRGCTSKTGARTFAGKVEPVNSFLYFGREISEIDRVRPEEVITAIDKDYNIIGQTVKRRLYENENTAACNYTQVERLLLPKKDDPAQICKLDITGHFGKNIESNPNAVVHSQHYRSRIALEPEVKYRDNKPIDEYRVGNTINESFHYSYFPVSRNGQANRYCDIGYIQGGESFYNKVSKMMDDWYDNHKVIRRINF